MSLYKFGWNEEDAVQCPELEAFVADWIAVCRKHGVGFDLSRESDYEGGYDARIVLVPFEEMDMAILTDDLEHSERGISWLDRARDEYERRRDERHRRADAAEREKELRLQREKAARMLEAGIVLEGKRYRLVEEGQ